MSTPFDSEVGEQDQGNPRLALLLAMAMFVLVIDTSLMNVSISSVVKRPPHDCEWRPVGDRAGSLVSAAFILTNSKLGDLMGRRRAYVIGLLAYAIGAVAMTLAQN